SNCARHAAARRGQPPASADPRAPGALALVAWSTRGRGPRLGSRLARLRAPLRCRAHLPLPQADAQLDPPTGTPPRASRPLDLARGTRLYSVASGSAAGGRPALALAPSPTSRQVHAGARPARVFAARGPTPRALLPAPTPPAARRD